VPLVGGGGKKPPKPGARRNISIHPQNLVKSFTHGGKEQPGQGEPQRRG
jgi:hypothetical protein